MQIDRRLACRRDRASEIAVGIDQIDYSERED